MKKILILCLLLCSVVWSIWYVTPKLVDYYEIKQGGCTVPRIHTGARRQQASEMYQNIDKFLVFIDYGADFDDEIAFLKCSAFNDIDDCNEQYSLNFTLKDHGLMKAKYAHPFYEQETLNNLIKDSVKMAYKECMKSISVEFTHDRNNLEFLQPEILGVYVEIPSISEVEKNELSVKISTSRFMDNTLIWRDTTFLYDYFVSDKVNGWPVDSKEKRRSLVYLLSTAIKKGM